MKRLNLSLGFLFIFAILFFPFVSSAGNCDPSQLILKLDSSTNAHGEVWDGSVYGTEICYDIIFGRPYVPQQGENPHACRLNDGNLVLKLSDVTNAHGESKDQGNYNTKICYGDLSCSIAQSEVCSQGQMFVVGLTANTNAHLSDSGQQGYLNVCCTVGIQPECSDGVDNDGDFLIDYPADPGCTNAQDNDETDLTGMINTAEWHDGLENVITESHVNNTVYLYTETSFPEGTQVSFDIKEKDAFSNDNIKIINANVNSQGIAKAQWSIRDEEMTLCGIGGLGEGDNCEFFYIASAGNSNLQSLILTVDNIEQKNIPPRANITAPINRGIYFINRPLTFNHTSKDENNLITRFDWKIEDQNGVVFQSTEETFSYAFPNNDQYIVTLKVTDEKGSSGEDQVGVVAVNSPGMIAFINKPFHKQIVVNEFLIVQFNASDSYVINVSHSGNSCQGIEIKCFAGTCPAKTQNYPSECSAPINLIGNLNQGFSSLNFDWEFDDGQKFTMMGLVEGEKVYPLASDDFNDKQIKLSLSYNSQLQDLLITKKGNRIFTLFDKRQCIDGGQTWVFLDENGFEIERRSTLDSSACAGLDGNVNTQEDNCCPSGFLCTQDGCRTDENAPEQCSDYSAELTCEEDAYRIARQDPMWNNLNCGKSIDGKVISCACSWNQTAGNGVGACGLEATIKSGGGGDPICKDYQCLYTYTEGKCLNGYMDVNIEAFFTPGTCGDQSQYRAECESGAGQHSGIPCGRPTIELPFFEDMQLIFAVLVIVVAYLGLHFLKKRE